MATTGPAAAEGVAGSVAIVAQAPSTREGDSFAGTTDSATSATDAGVRGAPSAGGACELAADDQFKTPPAAGARTQVHI